MKNFANLMFEARAATGMTLRELARQVGCAPSFLSQLEHGLKPAPKDGALVSKIASSLGIPGDIAADAAKRDQEIRDLSSLKKLFQDDALALSYCRAKELYSEEELRNLLKKAMDSFVLTKEEK